VHRQARAVTWGVAEAGARSGGCIQAEENAAIGD